jgi:hypothetical protein
MDESDLSKKLKKDNIMMTDGVEPISVTTVSFER